MDLHEYLCSHSLTLDDLTASIEQAIQLNAGDVLFAAGSLVEGLGNGKSDLDVFLLTRREDILLTSLNGLALLVRGCLIDVRVVQMSEVEALLDRFLRWASQPRHPRNALGIAYDDRKFLHRLSSGEPLFGETLLDTLRARLKFGDLARHKLDCARFLASTIQIDLSGLYQARDFLSMPFAAQDLLGYTADALVAGYGSTNPNPKWRARELDLLPDDWRDQVPGCPAGLSAAQMFVELHRAPAELTASSVFRHASRIVKFSRGVFPGIEYKLFGPREAALPRLPALESRSPSEDPLPHLDFDVQVSFQNGHFEMWRLNTPAILFELSPLGSSIVCLCDGESSKQETRSQAARHAGEDNAAVVVDTICEAIEYGGFELEAPVDENALRDILDRRMVYK